MKKTLLKQCRRYDWSFKKKRNLWRASQLRVISESIDTGITNGSAQHTVQSPPTSLADEGRGITSSVHHHLQWKTSGNLPISVQKMERYWKTPLEENPSVQHIVQEFFTSRDPSTPTNSSSFHSAQFLAIPSRIDVQFLFRTSVKGSIVLTVPNRQVATMNGVVVLFECFSVKR